MKRQIIYLKSLIGMIGGISSDVVQIVIDRWGQLEIDWFASSYNAKFQRFYSRFWNESCTGVDAFTGNWAAYYGLFMPPINML